MSITISNALYSPLPGGQGMLSGMLTFSSYLTSGEALDLSDYFSASTYPNVVVSSDDGYLARHNRGTASAGKVLLYVDDINATSNTGLVELANATNTAAVIIPFFAMGQVN